MIVPETVAWGTLAAGAVALSNGDFFMKVDDNDGANLSTGAVLSGFNTATPVISFPAASLKLD